jgi:hypothetical protein
VIRRGILLLALAVVAGIVIWNVDSHRTPKSVCSQVSMSLTEQAGHVGVDIGDVIHQLKSEAGAWSRSEVDRAVHNAGLFWKVVWAGIKTASAVGKLKADKTVTGMVPFKQVDCAKVDQACAGGGSAGTPPVDAVPTSWTLTGDALALDALTRAGFPPSARAEGVVIARLESSDIPGRVGPTVRGGTMRGMWQMNDRYYRSSNWANPYENARLALRAWRDGGSNWRLWTTHPTAVRQLGQGAQAATPPASAAPAPQCVQAVNAGGGPVPASFTTLGNPRSPEQAIAWLSGLVGKPIPADQCLHFVAEAYGRNGTAAIFGRHWAVDVFTAMPARYVGTGDPPRGALVFWRTGNPAGHIALSLGHGMVLSTDYPHAGTVGVAPLTALDRWGPRLGWAAPFFVKV